MVDNLISRFAVLEPDGTSKEEVDGAAVTPLWQGVDEEERTQSWQQPAYW